jgi:large subunit ribosomal protein L20
MRVKRGVVQHQRHKKIHKATKGYRLTKHALVKVAKEAILHAGQYAYNGRKKKKNDFKRLWIIRINAGLTDSGINYSRFIKLTKDKNVELNRKVLAYFAYNDKETFDNIVNIIKNK